MFGCALDTRGQYVEDSWDDVVLDIADDFVDADYSEVVDDFHVETADADSDYEIIDYFEDSTDTVDPCEGNSPPRIFHLISPSPDAVGESTRTVFRWGEAIDPEGGLVTYRLLVDDSDGLTSPVLDVDEIEINTYQIEDPAEALDFGIRHYWIVEATDPRGCSTLSALSPRNFTTREYPICSKVGLDMRVTENSGSSESPSLVFTSSEYGLSWFDNSEGNYEIYFAHLSDMGALLSTTRVTNDVAMSNYPSLSWTGSRYGLSWADFRHGNSEIYLTDLSATGVPGGLETRVTGTSEPSGVPSLAWTGSEFGVAWHDYRDGFANSKLYFNRISEDCTLIGSNIRVTNSSAGSYYPSLVWNGGGYGLCWHDNGDGNYEIYCKTISDTGTAVSSDNRITDDPGSSMYSSLAWTGSGYGLSWEDDRHGNGDIYFARLSIIGALVTTNIRVTDDVNDSGTPSLVCNDGEFAIAWKDNRDDNNEIYFGLILAGDIVSPGVRITNDSGNSIHPVLVQAGSEYGVAWQDDRNGNNEIYFARISCEP